MRRKPHRARRTWNTSVVPCGIPQTRFLQNLEMAFSLHLALLMVKVWVWERWERPKSKGTQVLKFSEIGSLAKAPCLPSWLMIVAIRYVIPLARAHQASSFECSC